MNEGRGQQALRSWTKARQWGRLQVFRSATVPPWRYISDPEVIQTMISVTVTKNSVSGHQKCISMVDRCLFLGLSHSLLLV